ncbi:putative Enoyl reductase (ER) domain-containing protein [Seiridium unicorne]|uniref:Enoyl reductase (ER) domain-containing protein n=1 Tax=Seiridium unicorne TaxID=138068 RepID=A0ABR2UJF6_9PEZI
MASNTAAWLPQAKARPFQIKPAPLGSPAEGQILVKNHAIAVNPIDGKLQSRAYYPLNYPVILGEDVAGEVVSVGAGVDQFNKGDRVLGSAAAFDSKKGDAAAFQEYTILDTHLTSKIPDHISYESAVVIPLGFSTASAGLFNPDFLNLQLPTHPAQSATGKTLLVWGGASSVGCNAIQLAVAAGYEVVATASPKNFELIKKLGASQVFDYNNAAVVEDLVNAFKGKALAGVYDTIGGPAWAPAFEFIKLVDGNKFVTTVIPGFPDPPEGVRVRQVYSMSIRNNGIGKAVWNDFLAKALEERTFFPAPDPLVVVVKNLKKQAQIFTFLVYFYTQLSRGIQSNFTIGVVVEPSPSLREILYDLK